MFKHDSVVLCCVYTTLTHVCHLHIHLLPSTYLQPTPYKQTLNRERDLVYLFLASVVECPRFTSMYSHIPTQSRISHIPMYHVHVKQKKKFGLITRMWAHVYVWLYRHETCINVKSFVQSHIPRQRCTRVCMDVPDCDVYI